ncbi:hypothetical protein WICPIJ_005608 [Wickerhamomyces pijperi]|uniref:Uncharacterized protein n=1 Tax=Wickerhamomyces pijperi TaxID=599730 RepID=A0A9P8TLR2_WICPI|nr:hypothetical protein WICPIJ_005608 [Wickerhamomyces pijperi]
MAFIRKRTARVDLIITVVIDGRGIINRTIIFVITAQQTSSITRSFIVTATVIVALVISIVVVLVVVILVIIMLVIMVAVVIVINFKVFQRNAKLEILILICSFQLVPYKGNDIFSRGIVRKVSNVCSKAVRSQKLGVLGNEP